METGWKCPGCQCIWAPSVKVCENCFHPPAAGVPARVPPRPTPQFPGATFTVSTEAKYRYLLANGTYELVESATASCPAE